MLSPDDHPKLDEMSLDGRTFVMVSSTASVVDSSDPTRFHYRQHKALIWGSYTGGTVSTGRFVGERTGSEVVIQFGHVEIASGQTVLGRATSRVEQAEDGRLRLVEDFAKEGVDHVSVCIEPAVPAR